MRRHVRGSQRGAGSEKADADLIAEMHLPDSDALGALFGRYIRLVHRVAVDILRDEGEAEDVTQEVFLEIYRKSHLYDPSRGAVRVWLLQYAYRQSLRRRAVLRRRAAYGCEPLDGVEPPIKESRQHLTRDECRWVIRTGLRNCPNSNAPRWSLRASRKRACERSRSGSACPWVVRAITTIAGWPGSGRGPSSG